MTRYLRASFILWVILRYGLDEVALSGFRLRALTRIITFGRRRRLDEVPRGRRLRLPGGRAPEHDAYHLSTTYPQGVDAALPGPVRS